MSCNRDFIKGYVLGGLFVFLLLGTALVSRHYTLKWSVGNAGFTVNGTHYIVLEVAE